MPARITFSPPARDPQVAVGTVVFNTNRGSAGNSELCTVDYDGGSLDVLTDDPLYHTWFPQVSPDRQHIVACRCRVADISGTNWQDYGKVSIWRFRADGTEATLLSDRPSTHTSPVTWTAQGTPHWSPDGQQIVYFGGPVRAAPGALAGLVMDFDGNRRTRFYDDAANVTDPCFSHPDHFINANPIDALLGAAGGAVRISRAIYACIAGGIWRFPSQQYDPAGTPEGITLIDDFTGYVADYDPTVDPSGRWLAWLTEFINDTHYGIQCQAINIANTGTPHILWGSGGDIADVNGNITSKPEFNRAGNRIFSHRYVGTGLAQSYDGNDTAGSRLVRCNFDEQTGVASSPVTILNDAHVNEFPYPV